MTATIYTSHVCRQHKLYPVFLEKPERLDALDNVFRNSVSKHGWKRAYPYDANLQDVMRAHNADYVTHLEALSLAPSPLAPFQQLVGGYVQWYTRVSHGSYDAAMASAGLVTAAVDDVLALKTQFAFCAGRPPGHHAGPAHGEGFCLLNNVAIGALKLMNAGKRVAIIDFDRHHGNGTEAILASRAPTDQFIFLSSFQEGCKYAQTDAPNRSEIIRLPIPKGSGYAQIAQLYGTKLQRVKDFHPDVLMLSAGFDMHHADPLSSIDLYSSDYNYLTNDIRKTTAGDRKDMPVISVLEGGYDPRQLAQCVYYHLSALKL